MSTKCPYSGCKLKCTSELTHRAKYAYISRRWKKKVEEIDDKISKGPSKLINYEELKKLGILWPIHT